MNEQNAIVKQDSRFLSPAATIGDAVERFRMMGEFVSAVMRESIDYGVIPGTGNKPTLYKPGAEKLTTLFGLSTKFEIIEKELDWTGENHGGEPFFYFHYQAQLHNGERLIAEGEGSCNSWERKYRYRRGERVCPKCGASAIIKGKKEYGGGWLCFGKKGGCNAKFRDGDPAIEAQSTGDVKNPDPADLVNTIKKMAQKRSFVAAVLIGTNASEYFTQDIEDFTGDLGTIVEGYYREIDPEPAKTEQPKTEPKPTQPKTQQPAPTHQPEPEPEPHHEQPKRNGNNKPASLPQLLVDKNLAENIPNAAQILNLLGLAGKPEADVLAASEAYRDLRNAGKEPDEAADLVKAGYA